MRSEGGGCNTKYLILQLACELSLVTEPFECCVVSMALHWKSHRDMRLLLVTSTYLSVVTLSLVTLCCVISMALHWE
eukprot:4117897-Amphidinium_carterae.2